jgi:hypothetical protein
LAKFLKLVRSVLSDFWKELTAGSDSGLGDLINSAKTLANETIKTVQLAGTAAAGVVVIAGAATTGLLVPTSAAEVSAANRTIANYKATLPTAESVSAQAVVPNQNKSTP